MDLAKETENVVEEVLEITSFRKMIR